MSRADEKGCFTLTWEIENIAAFLSSDDYGVLTSAAWKTETTNESSLLWCLSVNHSESVLVKKRKVKDRFEIQLICLNEDETPDECEISFTSSSGEIIQKHPNYYQRDSATFFVEKDLLDKSKMHSKNFLDTLTLNCKLWKKAMENGEFRINSVVQKVNFSREIIHPQAFGPERWLKYQKMLTEKGIMLINVKLQRYSSNDGNYYVGAVAQPMIAGCFSFVICKIISNEKINVKSVEDRGMYNRLRTEWRKDFLILGTSCICTLPLDFTVALHNNGQNQITRPFSAPITKTWDIHKEVIGDLAEDFLHLYRESILCDATLNTEGKSFSAHRSILAAKSPVFRAMFEKDEMNEGRSGVVHIDDVDSGTVDRMLVYMYGGSLEDVQWEEASTLYYAADKYDVYSLKKICADILKAGLSVSNACYALFLADKHSDEQLMKCVVDFIRDHHEVISSSDWDNLEENDSRLAAKILRQVFVMKGGN